MLSRFNAIEDYENERLPLIVFSIISIIVIGFTIFFFLEQTVSEFYKQKKLSDLTHEEILKKEKEYKILNEQVDRVFLQNQQIVNAFNEVFNKGDFLDFCNRYFEDSTITKIDVEGHKGEYITYDFKTIMKASSPKNFYDFLDSLSEYKNIIELEYPITMKADDEYIAMYFKIKVYSVDPKGIRGIEMFDDED